MKPRAERKPSIISSLAASSAVLAIVVIGLAVVLFASIGVSFVMEAIRYPLPGYSRALAEHIEATSDPAEWRRVARHHRVGILVETPEQRWAFDRTGAEVSPGDLEPHRREDLTIEVRTDDGGRIVFFWDLRHLIRGHNWVVTSFVILLIAFFGVTHWFQHRQLKPLRWLRGGVEAVARGDFDTTVPVVRQDEIGQVAGAFNQMTRHVARMVADRERLLADVSHELRSPLARMKVALELLPESEKRDAIQRDVREMETLISVLLEREHLRARTERLATVPVDLAELTRRVVETFGDRAPGVEVHVDGPCVVAADADLVRLLIQNLVDNALKFSLADSRPVEVGLRNDPSRVVLSVADDGRGIPVAHQERVFEPFVKLDPSRGHRSGYGLGLNLCQRIVEAHRGTITLSSNGERGTRVEVTF